MIKFQLSDPRIRAWIRLGQSGDIIGRLVDRTFAEQPLTAEEYKALLVVLNYPGVPSQRDIASWLGRSPNTVSALLYRMMQRGLVEQRQDPGDRRVFRIAATEEGRRLFWEVSPRVWEMVRTALQDLDTRDLERLAELLDTVRGRITGMLEEGELVTQTIPVDDEEQLEELARQLREGNDNEATEVLEGAR